MNENKSTQHMPSTVLWPKDTNAYPHPDCQNSIRDVLKSHAVLPPQPDNCSKTNSVQIPSFSSISPNPQTSSCNYLVSSKSHNFCEPSTISTRRLYGQYIPHSNLTNCGTVQMCNAPQTETYRYPNVNKTPSYCPIQSSLPNLKQTAPITSNLSQHEFHRPSQFTSANFDVTVNAFKDVPPSNFPVIGTQNSNIINGCSSSESQLVLNYVSNSRNASPQSSIEKVPLDNSDMIKRDNYNGWPQPSAVVSPAIMPPRRPMQNPNYVSSSALVGSVDSHVQINTHMLCNPINSHFPVFPNNTGKCHDMGPAMQFRYPPPLISKSNSSEQNLFASNVFPAQQSLHPNITFPPPSFPHGLYPAPPPAPMPPDFSRTSSLSSFPEVSKFKTEKERLLLQFLEKFHCNKKTEDRTNLTVVEFRSALKIGFSLSAMLQISKINLTKLLQSEDDIWNTEIEQISHMQSQLDEICSMISNSDNLLSMQRKIKTVKKKREQRKRQKQKALSAKMKAKQNRKEINQEIDKWLDSIKEKNLKLKREAEMKKEADNILSEVRKKIQEAKRTIEKIKVFEKLRNARQANAIKKSLFLLPEHNEKFETKVSVLKETMLKQLADYEAEEKALKVMLETEQEGQLEEEAVWRIKKIKSLQLKKQKNIYECLFGDSVEPSPEDPLYLFHNYQDSANKSIENLVQIRHHWDVHLMNDGDAIPQQWVVPVPSSNASWEILSDIS